MKMGSIEEIHETFSYFVQQIKDKYPKFAYLHVVESRIGGSQDIPSDKKETLDFLVSLLFGIISLERLADVLFYS